MQLSLYLLQYQVKAFHTINEKLICIVCYLWLFRVLNDLTHGYACYKTWKETLL